MEVLKKVKNQAEYLEWWRKKNTLLFWEKSKNKYSKVDGEGLVQKLFRGGLSLFKLDKYQDIEFG